MSSFSKLDTFLESLTNSLEVKSPHWWRVQQSRSIILWDSINSNLLKMNSQLDDTVMITKPAKNVIKHAFYAFS